MPGFCLFLNILNKIINAPCGTLKLLLALGVTKYIKSYKIHFVVQYATDYCPLEHDNYKTISAHLGSPISCYINNLHGAFIFLLGVHTCCFETSKPNGPCQLNQLRKLPRQDNRFAFVRPADGLWTWRLWVTGGWLVLCWFLVSCRFFKEIKTSSFRGFWWRLWLRFLLLR